MKPLLAAFLLFAVAPINAQATTVVWELGGTVEQVSLPTIPGTFEEPDRAALLSEWGIVVGATWSGRMSFDSAAAVLPSFDPTLVNFATPHTQFEFEVGVLSAATAASDPWGSAGLDLGNPAVTTLTFHASTSGSTLPGAVPFFPFIAILELVAPHGEVFSTNALPIDPPDVEDLVPLAVDPLGGITGTHFRFFEYVFIPATEDQPIPFMVDGRITSIVRVPEPGASLLLVIAIFAASARRARRRVISSAAR